MDAPPTQSPVTPETSFEDYFQTHYARIYGLLYRVTGNASDADDLAQDVFLQLYRRPVPLAEDPAVDGWLWRAATHTALNALRGNRRRREREERSFRQDGPLRLVAQHAADPGETMERRAQQEAVRAALRQLKPQESGLLLLRHAGLSYREIAAALDLNPASVGTLLTRAERRFKEHYHD